MKVLPFFLCIMLLLSACGKKNVIPLGHEITLESISLGEERVISIYLPEAYEQSIQKYPVLYVLDGNAHFHHASGAVHFLSNPGYMPQMIVVAIQNVDRTRDFSPVHVDNMPTSGGAEKFLDFIAGELVPYINENYRTSSYDILVGHSFGGTFANYTLLEKPGLFDAYIAISPFLQFAENYMVEESKTKLRSKYENSIYFYMTLGEEPAYFEALDALSDLVEEKVDSNFHFEYVKIDTENHNTIPYISIFKGLRFIFSDWQPSDETIEKGLEAIDAHYVKISEKYGSDITAPENLLNVVGYTYLQNEDFENAITVFKANTKRYPDSPNVYDSYGEALETNGQINLAKKNYKIACELAKKQDHQFIDIFKANYERVK
jgi:hypothetical protein